METKFTKGPWSARIDKDLYSEVGRNGDPQSFISSHRNEYSGVTKDCAVANAHLIAAAPEMYEMLAELLNDSRLVYGDDYDAVEKLLSKARGEQC
jgi:hypothetical protein